MMSQVMQGSKMFALCCPPPSAEDTLIGAIALVLNVKEVMRSGDGSYIVSCLITHPRRKVTSYYGKYNRTRESSRCRLFGLCDALHAE
jgi:hypothetical protein